MKVAFIGGGVMAEAILLSICSRGIASMQDISVGEALEERCRTIRDRHNVFATTNNKQAAEGAEVIILAVKPPHMIDVLSDLRGALGSDQIAISIVAGIPMAAIVNGLDHPLVVRAMPNTPAQISEGVTLWTGSPAVEGHIRESVESVLNVMGLTVHVTDEKYLDMATALSASGPAYVYLFVESLIEAGVFLGLPRDLSRTLTLQTVLGSIKLANETGKHPADLRNMVTSPNGTTAAGLLALEEGGLRATVMSAVIAAYEKSLDLKGQV